MTTATVSQHTLPGPRPLPLVGSRGNYFQFLRDPVAYVITLHREFGSIAGMFANNPSTVFAFGPEYNHQILSNQELFLSPSFIVFPNPEGSSVRRLDAGLISMNGAQHKQHRRLMQPAFHKKQVEGYRDAMVAITQRVLDSWTPGQERDLSQDMQYLTMLISSKTLFGLDDPQDAAEVGDMVARWLGSLFSPAVVMFPVDLPGTPYRRTIRHAERMEAVLRARIAHKRANPSEQNDVMAVLIHTHDENGEQMTDAELIGQANNLFSAGHETSANALSWTLFLLAQHPQVLADLVDELEGELRGDAPTVEQLGRLTLLDWVVKESMRVLPPVTLLRRDSAEPFELGQHRFGRGTIAMISQYITHHMPELYPEPARFLPQRWATIRPSIYEYLPFGAGPHMCIGASFALMEIKIVLAMLLQRYRLTLRPHVQIDRQVKVVMSPRQGLPMHVAPQDRQFTRHPVRGNVHEMVDLMR